jgi:tetratricopeptide (TPR) repeat protein
MKRIEKLLICIVLLSFSLAAVAVGQSGSSRKPALIKDTGEEEEQESAKAQEPKERNPVLAEKNVHIGNAYFKKRNYIAAIDRYLEALEYQPDSIPAHEALGRAYEKNGDISKAVDLYTKFIEKNPDSPKSLEFRDRAAKLQKKSYLSISPAK